jgi:hypothetical protein
MSYMTEDPRWVTFYPEFGFGLYVEKAGYFDERPELHTSVTQLFLLIALPFLLAQSVWFLGLLPFLFMGWGRLYINLPIKTGIQDCDSAAWGVNYHDSTIWIYIGGGGNDEGGRKCVTIPMPWKLTWVRNSTLLQDGYSYFHETNKLRVSWFADKEGERYGSHEWLNKNKWRATYLYLDKSDNTEVNATISVSEMEWRPLWFQWTGLFSKIKRTIDVEFDKGVGGEKGSWKGGVYGCGYELKKGETPFDCLKRMETERIFDND